MVAVLEIGVYVGLSSLMWSQAVGPDGKFTGLEFDISFSKMAEEPISQIYTVLNPRCAHRYILGACRG